MSDPIEPTQPSRPDRIAVTKETFALANEFLDMTEGRKDMTLQVGERTVSFFFNHAKDTIKRPNFVISVHDGVHFAYNAMIIPADSYYMPISAGSALKINHEELVQYLNAATEQIVINLADNFLNDRSEDINPSGLIPILDQTKNVNVELHWSPSSGAVAKSASMRIQVNYPTQRDSNSVTSIRIRPSTKSYAVESPDQAPYVSHADVARYIEIASQQLAKPSAEA